MHLSPDKMNVGMHSSQMAELLSQVMQLVSLQGWIHWPLG